MYCHHSMIEAIPCHFSSRDHRCTPAHGQTAARYSFSQSGHLISGLVIHEFSSERCDAAFEFVFILIGHLMKCLCETDVLFKLLR